MSWGRCWLRVRCLQGLPELAGKDRRGVHRGRLVSTGDLGWLDSSGRLHLAGRRSTMIVTAGGENVQPDTIEEAYQKHPAIEEIAVLEHQGKIVGLIVPKVGEAATATPKRQCARRSPIYPGTLPSYQRLADFAVTREAIPRTRLGKPRRHLLAGRYEQAMRGDSQAVVEPRGRCRWRRCRPMITRCSRIPRRGRRGTGWLPATPIVG